jgi:hypothetical protein
VKPRAFLDDWGVPLAVWAISRLGLMLVSAGSLAINGVLERPGGSLALHAIPALDALCRWDCAFIEEIATLGYQRPEMSNFFPLLPLLVRGAAQLGVPVYLGLLLVPNLATLLGYAGIYRVFRHLAPAEGPGAEAPVMALSLFAAFPFSFFHGAGYPESLMFCATAWAFALALEERPWAAALVLGVGTLTRHLAFLAWPALALVVLARVRRKQAPLHSILSLAVPPLVFALWMGWQAWRFGDPIAFLHARAAWAGDAWWGAPAAFKADAPPQYVFYVLFSALPTLGALALFRKDRWPLASYALLYLGMAWVIGLAGLGRYTASFWPAFLPLGLLVTRYPWLGTPLLILFAAAQGVFFTLFAHQAPIL